MLGVKKFTTSTLYKNVDFNRCPILDLNLLGCYLASFLIAIQRFGTQKNVPKRCIALNSSEVLNKKKKTSILFQMLHPTLFMPSYTTSEGI
jgi:hypothetical protein